jgi:putative SOS response-associated peptidase YedK
MCGRYDLSDNPAAIRATFAMPAVPDFAPNADLCPTGDPVETYTIVTRAANERIAPIHDRMPVIVATGQYLRWLDPAQDAQSLVVPRAELPFVLACG